MTRPQTVEVALRQHTIYVRLSIDSYGMHRAEWQQGGVTHDATDLTHGLVLNVARARMRRIDAESRVST